MLYVTQFQRKYKVAILSSLQPWSAYLTKTKPTWFSLFWVSAKFCLATTKSSRNRRTSWSCALRSSTTDCPTLRTCDRVVSNLQQHKQPLQTDAFLIKSAHRQEIAFLWVWLPTRSLYPSLKGVQSTLQLGALPLAHKRRIFSCKIRLRFPLRYICNIHVCAWFAIKLV